MSSRSVHFPSETGLLPWAGCRFPSVLREACCRPGEGSRRVGHTAPHFLPGPGFRQGIQVSLLVTPGPCQPHPTWLTVGNPRKGSRALQGMSTLLALVGVSPSLGVLPQKYYFHVFILSNRNVPAPGWASVRGAFTEEAACGTELSPAPALSPPLKSVLHTTARAACPLPESPSKCPSLVLFYSFSKTQLNCHLLGRASSRGTSPSLLCAEGALNLALVPPGTAQPMPAIKCKLQG